MSVFYTATVNWVNSLVNPDPRSTLGLCAEHEAEIAAESALRGHPVQEGSGICETELTEHAELTIRQEVFDLTSRS
jgi:hypothetical protein